MNSLMIKSGGVVCALTLSFTSQAEPPAGVGSADVETQKCYSTTVVGPPGDFLPFLDGVHGVMLVEVGNAKVVLANSARGNRKLTCKGSWSFGESTEGIDVVTGLPGTGINVDNVTACEALRAFGIGSVCKQGRSAVIVDATYMGDTCNINGVETLDWKQVVTNSGQVLISCHSMD